jgi:hypothetical protein
MRGAAALLIVMWSWGALRAETSAVFHVDAACPGGVMPGTAFLVENWRPVGDPLMREASPLLLVTALHVIDRCSEVVVKSMECGSARGPQELIALPVDTEVLVWPSHDLAAIPISDPAPYRAPDSFRMIASLTELPPDGVDIEVIGESVNNPCSHNPGKVNGKPRVDEHAKTLANKYSTLGPRSRDKRAAAFRGSLVEDARMIRYGASSASEGASGGPVILPDSHVVLAVHNGGHDEGIRWGIVPLDLPPARRAHLGRKDWPAFTAPTFPNATLSDLRAPSGPEAKVFKYLFCGAEYETGGEVYGMPAAMCQVRFSGHASWLGSAGSRGLYAGALLVYRMSHYDHTFVAPDGTVLESTERRGHGVGFGFHVELHLRRLQRWRVIVGTGIRFGFTHVTGVETFSEMQFHITAPLELSLIARPVGEVVNVGVRVSLLGEMATNLRRTYNGNPTGDPLRDGTLAFTTLGGLGAFVEF